MKRFFILMSLASVALFAGCQKNEIKEVSVEENASTFELVADIAQTKTTLDGRVVEWEEGDIIYMVTSDGTWGVPYLEDDSTESIAEFTYAGGKFSTPATIADGSYTFNAIYSNGSQMSYHRSDKTTNQLSATQNQNCANPTAHIKKYDALVGTITASVPMNEPAKLTMSHLYTMMQVNIVNNTGADITVSKFEMTVADADLAGVFTVTSFATPAITAKVGEADTKTITVNVTGGTVAKDATLPVYFVMAPLSDYSGNVTFKVTDSEEKTYTKTIGLSGITFEAGKYNTTPYAISEADEVDEVDYSGTYAILAYRNSESLYYYLTNELTTSSTKRLVAEAAGTECPADGVEVNNAKLWTLAKSGNTYTVQSVASENFISWSSGNSATLSSTGLQFTITKNDNGTYLLNKGDRYLSLNSNTGTNYFAMYTGTQSQNLYLIKAVEGEETVPELTGITVNATKTTFTVGDEFEFAGTVTANYSNGTTKDVTASATFSGYDKSKQGTQTITVTYEGKTATYDITVNPAQSGGDEPDQPGEEKILKLTNANIVSNAVVGATIDGSYKNYTITADDGSVFKAGCIWGFHSKATNSQYYLQIKKDTKYYIQLPQLSGNIKKIVMTVSSSQKPMDGGGNTATLGFGETSTHSSAIATGTGASTVEISVSGNLSTGYITASGAVRVWDIEITYQN